MFGVDRIPAVRLLPFGRALDNFRDQNTASRLLPAEDALLAAVAKGIVCDLDTSGGAPASRSDLPGILRAPELIALAAEFIVCPWLGPPSDDPQQAVSEHAAWPDADVRAAEQKRVVEQIEAELAAAAGVATPVLDRLAETYVARLGRWYRVDPDNAAVRIRAGFLRFLALGGSDDAPVHESGVRLKGAWIDGELDLTSCDNVRPLRFEDCFFTGKVMFTNARLPRLQMSGCCVPAIEGARCRTESSLLFTEGFLSFGPVMLLGATIRGALHCGRGIFQGGLNCANADIAGDVFLSSGFRAKSEVSLNASVIGSKLNCNRGTFCNLTANGRGMALNCDAVIVKGSVALTWIRAEGRVFFMGAEVRYSFELDGSRIRNRIPDRELPALQCQGAKIQGDARLRNGFVIEGGAGFAGAKIDGMLDCSASEFSNLDAKPPSPADRPGPRLARVALDLEHATIDQALCLGPRDSPRPMTIVGSLVLTGAHAKMFVDHPDSWPPRIVEGRDGEPMTCFVALDGFTYDTISDSAPTDARQRLRWLKLQPPTDLGAAFRPQPFEQLVKVLRGMGHDRDAQQVAVAKLRNRRRARQVEAWSGCADWPLGWPNPG